MATIDHYTVLGCSHLTMGEQVCMDLARRDESARYVSLAMQRFLDEVTFHLVASEIPDIFGAGFYVDWDRAKINRKLRKRHARYRRGREAVRPRHRRTK